MDGGILAVVAAVVGYVLRPVDEWLRGVLVSRKERAQRRADFQRDTLYALQDAIYDVDRAAGQVAPRKGLTYRGPNDPDPVAVLEDAQHRVNKYRVRLEDAELAEAVLKFYGAAMLQAIGQHTMESMNDKQTNLDKANERIGVLLKALH